MQERIRSLIDKYMSQPLTEQETRELDDFIDEHPMLREQLDELGGREARAKALKRIAGIDIEKNLHFTLKKVHKDRMIRKTLRIGVPMMLIILIVGYCLFRPDHKQAPAIASAPFVAPPNNKPVLILPDNARVALDKIPNGPIHNVPGVIKLDSNTLSYWNPTKEGLQIQHSSEGVQTIASESRIHTLIIPTGGTFKIILADSTVVWANTATTLHYPPSFTGLERNVSLAGEAYFEVAKDAQRPFSVTANGMDVDVLGTKFNITAYPNEATITTTLLEGSVNLRKDKAHCLLKQRDQGILDRDQKGQPVTNKSWILRHNIDPDEILAWKKNEFSFSNADLSSVLRQLSRWYNVDIQQGATSSRPYDLSAERSVSLFWLLDRLKLHYQWKDKQLIVTE